MDNDRVPAQAAPAWSTQAHASSSEGDNDNDSIKFVTRSADGEDVEMDEAHDSGTGLHAMPTSKLVPALVGVEENEAMDVTSTAVDRASPNEVKAQGLGPMEDIDHEVFRIESRPLGTHPSSALTREVVVCKFCDTEFPYVLRDMDQHKSTCEAYKEKIGRATDATAEEDADLPTLSLDGDGDERGEEEGDDDKGDEREVSSPSSPSENQERTDEEEASVKEGGGVDQESAEDEDETQMLDSEPDYHVSVQDRVREPYQAPPTLAVARERQDAGDRDAAATVVASDGGGDQSEVGGQQEEAPSVPEADQGVEVDQCVEGDDMDTGGVEDEAGGGRDEEAGDEVSIGNGSNQSDVIGDDAAQASTPNSQFRVIDDKGDRVECIVCEKTFKNRTAGMKSHRKKCQLPKQTPQDQSTTRGDKQVPLLTPQKKPSAKRRISQELEKLEGEVIATDQANLFGLRLRKRSKAEDAEASVTSAIVSTATATTAAASGSTTAGDEHSGPIQERRRTPKRDEDPCDQFVLVGDLTQTKRMVCKHCKAELTFRRDQAAKHLSACDAYKASVGEQPAKRSSETQMGAQAIQKRAKGALALTGKGATTAGSLALRRPEELTVTDVLALDAESFRTWIFGTPHKATEMQDYFGVKPSIVRASVNRFHVVQEALHDFDVKKILDTSPVGTKFTVLYRSKNARPPAIEMPRAQALASYQNGFALSFRPPKTVVDMIVPGLAQVIGCGPLVSPEAHEVQLVCAQEPFKLDWQFHKWSSVFVCLQGKLLWKMQRGVVKVPASSFQPMPKGSEELIQQLVVQISATKPGTKASAFAPPAGSTFDFRGEDEDDDDDMEGVAGQATTSTSQKVVVDAGSVVYMPPGTWYQADVLDDSGPCMLLQIQLKGGGIGDILIAAMQKVVTTEEWRARELEAWQRTDATYSQVAEKLVREALANVQALLPNELMPLLLTEGVAPNKIVADVGGKAFTKVYEFDLTERGGFVGSTHIRFLEGSMFHVNPLSAMLTMDELTQYDKGIPAAISSALVSVSTATSKKVLNRKQKRPGNGSASASSSESSNEKGVFVYGWGSGDATKMMVKFLCSKPQGVLVEWIRSRDTNEPIHVGELKMILKAEQGGTADVDLLKRLLRFLCTIGYLAHVEVPLGGE